MPSKDSRTRHLPRQARRFTAPTAHRKRPAAEVPAVASFAGPISTVRDRPFHHPPLHRRLKAVIRTHAHPSFLRQAGRRGAEINRGRMHGIRQQQEGVLREAQIRAFQNAQTAPDGRGRPDPRQQAERPGALRRIGRGPYCGRRGAGLCRRAHRLPSGQGPAQGTGQPGDPPEGPPGRDGGDPPAERVPSEDPAGGDLHGHGRWGQRHGKDHDDRQDRPSSKRPRAAR